MNIKTSKKTAQIQKTKKSGKIKKLFKWTGLSILMYSAISTAFINNKVNRIDHAVSESTFLKYKSLENQLYDENEFLKYYENYNYTEEMFQKDLSRYHNYEKWLYQQYQEMVKRNNLIDNTSEEEFNQIINHDQNYLFKKWSDFKQLSTNTIGLSDNLIKKTLISVYLTKNDENYGYIKDILEQRSYEENKMDQYFKNHSFSSLNERKLVVNSSLTAAHPLFLRKIEDTVGYKHSSMYQAQKATKGIYFKDKKVEDNITNLSKELIEAYKLRKIHANEEYEEKTKNLRLNEYNKINYDRDFQYHTFKTIHVFNHLSDQITGLISQDGEKNYKIIKENNVFLQPAFYAYMTYKDIINDNDEKKYSNLYSDDDLFQSLSGVADFMIKDEIKNGNSDLIIIDDITESYPFLK